MTLKMTMPQQNLPEFLCNPDPEIYYSDNYVVLDFETTNIDKGSALNPRNRLVLSVWNSSERTKYSWAGELDLAELVADCNAADFLVAHNAKFELQWLERCGYDIGSRPVYCTLDGEWVIAGNRKRRLDLDSCLKRHNLGHKASAVSKLIKAGVCPSEIPQSMLLRYGLADVRLTKELFKRQLEMMEGTRLLPIQYTRCLTIPPLADIEKHGLHLDAERVNKEYEETLAEYNAVMAELDSITDGINPRSPDQVAHFVYGKLGFKETTDRSGTPLRNKPSKQFPDGRPKTDKETLLSLRATTKDQKRFVELKQKQSKLAAALDKNLSMFVGACREADGMIYAEILQGRTATHRLASAGKPTKYDMFDKPKGCQFHNLPRKYKPLFSARHEGWLFGEADGATLEFGVAGHLGRDPVIRQEIKDRYDVHSFTQHVISTAGNKEISRTGAKRHTFKPLYGGESGTPAERAYYEAFRDKYIALSDTQEGWCLEVGNNKQLETEWGMIFYWPEARISTYGRLNVKTSVYNYPIQSLATADIIPIGLVFFWHRTRGSKMLLVNTVHDSIEAEFPPEERELFERTAVQALTHDVYTYLDRVYDMQFTVQLGVGMKIGTHWGETLEGEEETKIYVETPYAS